MSQRSLRSVDPKRSERPKRKPRSLWFKLLAAALVLVVTGTLSEVLARKMNLQTPNLRGNNNNEVIMVAHPTRLWGMVSGNKNNAGARATINALGLRGTLPVPGDPPDQARVLILGDSTFFGHGVEDDETLSVRLQERLRSAGVGARVLNGAVPGYSTEQARLLLDEIGWDLEPTLLVVGCLWSDNNWDLFRDRDLLRTQGQFNNNPLAHSHYYPLLAGWIDRLRGGDGARIVTWTRNSEWPTVGVRRVSLLRYAENLDAMARAASRRGIGMVLMRPVNVEVVEDLKLDGGFSWDPYVKLQEQMAAFHGIPIVSLQPSFGEAFARLKADPLTADTARTSLFLDRMHPTPFGQDLIAQTLADALMTAGWPDDLLLGRTEGHFPFEDMRSDAWFQPKGEVGKQLSPFQGLFEEGR
jgi:lysophospholipase L1-like esterase